MLLAHKCYYQDMRYLTTRLCVIGLCGAVGALFVKTFFLPDFLLEYRHLNIVWFLEISITFYLGAATSLILLHFFLLELRDIGWHRITVGLPLTSVVFAWIFLVLLFDSWWLN
jgi:hypothetical protein